MTRNGSYSNMELPLDDEDSNSANRIKDANGSIPSQEVENEDDDIIGPALPPQNNMQAEEEYIHRLMEFEAQKSQVCLSETAYNTDSGTSLPLDQGENIKNIIVDLCQIIVLIEQFIVNSN